MKLIYYKADGGNFGDDINPWLWEKLFGDFEKLPDFDFVGIGSIFDGRLHSSRKKIVFGTGVRSFLYDLADRNNYDIRFVRGPISAKVINGVNYITDSAYALGLLPEIREMNFDKKYKISLIPHYTQVPFFNWKLFKMVTGINVILPTDSVERVIYEIGASEKVVAGAMHGAIIADVLRVPWIRCRIGSHDGEELLTSEIKWLDYLLSMKLENVFLSLPFSINADKSLISLALPFEKIIKLGYLIKRNTWYHLSDKDLYNEKLVLINEEISKLKKEFFLT